MCNNSPVAKPSCAPAGKAQVADAVEKTSKRATEPAAVSPDAEFFAGVVKSYNERRGFGFVSCDETAKKFGRDVYLSKVESQNAIGDGATLKEGEHVMFSVVPSEEGFPQAAAVQRLHLLHGTVLHYCKDQGGIIACGENAGIPEVAVKPSDCGSLILHPGDSVSFSIEGCPSVWKLLGKPEAKLIQLLKTVRPPCALLGCFSFEFPHLVFDSNHTDSSGAMEIVSVLDGHAFGSSICFAGLPANVGQAELSKLFTKIGATHVTVSHSCSSGLASIQFPDISMLARFLTGKSHAFTDQSRTLVAHLRPCRQTQVQTLPALQPPTVVPGEIEGIFVAWEPVSFAMSYTVEIRTLGAQGWSPVDSFGRVQPAGAVTALAPQSSCLAIAGLSPGMTYEARVSYSASCGCKATSDPSAQCVASGGMQLPPLQMASPVFLPPYTLQSEPITMAPHPVPPPPLTCGAHVGACGCTPLSPGALTPTSLSLLQAPPQPEMHVANGGNALIVRWRTVGPLANSYIIEMRENTASSSNFFTRLAPQNACDSLELCVQGLAAGRSYIACVRSVAQDGTQSLSSPWSFWLTLPMPLQPYDFPPSNGVMHAPCMPALPPQAPVEMFDKPLQKLAPTQTERWADAVDVEKHMNLTGIQGPPEVTGQEEMMLFLD
jgi:cold shock CspA family protein